MARAISRYALLLAILLVVGLVVFVAFTYLRFRADVQPNRERLLSGGRIVTTEEFGDIEYAIQGKGLPVLVVHGAGGGYDQGLLIGENYVGDGHRFIAPSRFGYVRSSIPQNGSPVAQADAYAALLDTLGIERVAVVGFSDGGLSALQFALLHPERCAVLVMISTKASQHHPTQHCKRWSSGVSFARITSSGWLPSTRGRSCSLCSAFPAKFRSNSRHAQGSSPLRWWTV